MFSNETTGYSLSDIAAASGNNDFNGGWGMWIWVILIFAIFGNWGGFGSNGATTTAVDTGALDNYVLASDFATLQRQIDAATDRLSSQSTEINGNICNLAYEQLGQFNSINSNVSTTGYAIQNAITQDTIANLQNTNNLSSQLADAYNNVRYDNLQNANATQNIMTNGFAEANYNNATNACALKTQLNEVGTALATQMANSTRDIVDSNNAGVQAILTKLNEQEMNAKQAQIDALTQQVNSLTLAASQQAQNNAIIGALRPSPIPAYNVPNPYSAYGYNCTGCGA